MSAAPPVGGLRPLILAVIAAAVVLTAALLPAGDASAAAGKNFDVGFADMLYEDSGQSDLWMKRTRAVNADVIRVNMYWSSVAHNKPANPRDPDDPAYNWSAYDLAIRNAAQYGFQVDLTVFSAPSWAEGPNRPSLAKARAGVWRPDPQAYGDFAHAVAKRYSGSFSAGGSTLPAVKYFEAWNEPNLSSYIMPQWSGKKNVSSEIYGALLNRFYEGVKAENPQAKVVSGGTAPYGDPPGGPKTQPIRFYQELLCLNTKDKRSKCPNGEAPKFDIIAHHPINRVDPPTKKAINKGDVEIADMHVLTKTLRKAEKLHTPATSGHHQVWANEVWWQTDPPDKREGISLRTHARWTAQAMYLLWKQGVSNITFLQLRDAKYKKGESTLASYQTGIYTYKGKRKPTAAAVAFPFVTHGKGKHLAAWGIAPRSGKLTIQASSGGRFKRVATVHVKGGRVFTRKLHVRGKGRLRLRAKVGHATSPVWVQK